MQIVLVWHSSPKDIPAFTEKYALAEALISTVPDAEMRFAVWGLYRVTVKQHRMLAAVPRLTWVGG